LLHSALIRTEPLSPDWVGHGSRFKEDVLDLGFDSILARVVTCVTRSNSETHQISRDFRDRGPN
jgi:hypothetical protein